MLLAAFSFFVATAFAQIKPDTSDPYNPNALSKLPFEPPLPDSVQPLSPAEVHPQDRAAPVPAAAPVTASFQQAVEITSRQPAPTFIRSHVQGEILPEQHGPPSPSLVFPRSEPLPPPHVPPTGGPVQSNAPGDPLSSFDGLANTGWIPPDTIMGVGPNHVLEATNSGFAVYNKSGGALQGYTTFENFFAPLLPVAWDGILFDPRVIYSPEHSRFVIMALGVDRTNLDSVMFLAFSQTTDPTGLWWLYSIDHQIAPVTDVGSWADYCGLGADTWGVYITCNTFLFTGSFKYAKLWSLNTGGFAGGAITGTVFFDLRWNSNSLAGSLQPALPHTVASDQATFFVNTFTSSGSAVLLWKLTGDRTTSPVLTRATITTPGYEAVGENVDQPGTAADLDAGDARIMNAVYSSRRVFTVLTDDVDNDGAQAGWLTLKLDVDANTLDWSHLINSGPGFYYFYPAITMEGAVGGADGNLAIFGSWTDGETTITPSTTFASSLFKIYTDQPTNSNGPFSSYQNGAAAYESRDSNGRNRWGDYSGAGFDWSTGTVWGAAEYAGSGNTWRTRITARKINEAGCDLDAFEPDGTSLEAKPITTNGVAQTHNICPAGDNDWVSFVLPANSSVQIETSGPAGDTRMWLRDAGLNEIEFDDDGGGDLFSVIDRTCGVDSLPAGTYFVEIDEFGDNAEIGTYNLAVTAAACPCIPDSFEPDGTSGQASSISSGIPQAHSICPASEEDWATFTLAQTSQVMLETSGPEASDTRMWLYNAALGQIEFDDDDGLGAYSFIDRRCGVDPLPAGTYFVQIDEFGDNDEIFDYSLEYSLVGPCCVSDLVISGTTVTGPASFVGQNTVTLGPDLIVDGTGVNITAGNSVSFQPGTDIGASFSLTIDSGVACP